MRVATTPSETVDYKAIEVNSNSLSASMVSKFRDLHQELREVFDSAGMGDKKFFLQVAGIFKLQISGNVIYSLPLILIHILAWT